MTRCGLCRAAEGASLSPADDADFGGDLLETVQETQNDEEEQALTGSQVNFCPGQCMWACFCHLVATFWLANMSPASLQHDLKSDMQGNLARCDHAKLTEHILNMRGDQAHCDQRV